LNDLISIKVQIANRPYPLKVRPDQENAIRRAVDAINARLKEYESTYAVRDIQDLLAMYTIHITTEQLGIQSINDTQKLEIEAELDNLSALVNSLKSI